MPIHGKKNAADSAKPRTSVETSKNDEKDTMFDSGRADSGFLSGGSNLLSGYSEEIPLSQSDDRSSNKKVDSKCDSYSRLDSGVGLSDQLSEMCIQEDYNDLGRESSPTLDSKMNIALLQPALEKQPSELVQFHDVCFQQDEDGDTQLHIAVMRECEQAVLSLIRMVPSSDYLDIRNAMRQTALHIAVLVSSPRIVELLVAAGARRDNVDHHGNTPLHLAVAAGDSSVVNSLLRPSLLPTVLGRLCYVPSYHPPKELNMVNYQGLSCVHIAMLGGHIELVKDLVHFGADVNARDYKSGKSVLHMAAERGDTDSAEMLVRELSANRYLLTYAGESAYRIAVGAAADKLRSLGAYVLGDSDDEDEDHLCAHADDPDYQIFGSFREFHMNGCTVTA